MKKFLLIVSSVIAVSALLIAGWNPFGSGEKVGLYKPRTANFNSEHGAHGWIEYMKELKRNYYTGEIEIEDILATRKALNKFSRNQSKSNDMEWRTLGPDNIGGRVRALWIDPNNDNHLWAGAASGGVWKTTDGGNTWEAVESFNKNENFMSHMPIGFINRTGSGIYYVGTGSQHENFNPSGSGTPGFIGNGLFRSTNTEGTEWERVFGPDQYFNTNQPWLTVDAIELDPSNPEKMWIAHSGGLDVYIHGNATLEPRPAGLPGTAVACEDVDISPDGQVIVTSVNTRGYISTNGGQSFTMISGTLANGGPNVIGAGGNSRIEFAVSRSPENYVYASVVNTNQSLRGVFASWDQGSSWYRIAQDVNDSGTQPALFQPFGGVGGQGRWDNTLSVNPLNPKQIFLGGLVIYSHTIVGNVPSLSNWEQRSLYSTNYLNPFAVHPDVHRFVWDSNNIFWACTDGGFFKSTAMATSNMPTFFTANQGFVTTQFYAIAHGEDGRTIGGTQDNGTLYQNLQGPTENHGFEVFGGDGFDCEISFLRPELLIGSSQFGTILRSVGGGFGEFISPPPGSSSDFTTNLRLVETEFDPYSQRGMWWGADTLLDAFIFEQQTWPDGSVTLGYVPEGHWILHFAAADQRELWTQTTENMYYYETRVTPDTTFFTFIDTTETITEINFVDTTFFPVDTTFTLACDTVEIIVDTTYTDTCTLFMGQIICVNIDTTYTFADTVLCEVVDTIIDFDFILNFDTTFTYITEEVTDFTIDFIVEEHIADSLFLVDPVQTLFTVGHGGGLGIWVTRDVTNTAIDPEWWFIGNVDELVNSMEWSPDRDHLYVGTSSGRLLRFSGFNQVYHADDLDNITVTTLITGGPPINNIAVDYSEGTGGPDAPPASETVVIARSTYGVQNKVLRSTVAASTSSSNTFQSIFNVPAPLDRMPVYSCVISKDDPNVIVIGTEVGIFRTDDGGGNWYEANGGLMDRVPVLDLRQQYREHWEATNSGVIYAGTHGRGIFDNDDFLTPWTSVQENEGTGAIDEAVMSSLIVFPNPMNTHGWVEFDLREASDVRMVIFNINGQMMEQIHRERLPAGNQQVQFSAEKLSAGTYLIRVEAGGIAETKRFIVTR